MTKSQPVSFAVRARSVVDVDVGGIGAHLVEELVGHARLAELGLEGGQIAELLGGRAVGRDHERLRPGQLLGMQVLQLPRTEQDAHGDVIDELIHDVLLRD